VSARLDFTNPAEVADWLEGLRVSFEDLDGAASDMLEPPRRRRLGPKLHAENYRAARAQIRTALAYAAPEPDEGEPSDPAGNPGHSG
jgi:hypothetical protein